MNIANSIADDKSQAVEKTAKSVSEFIENFKARTYEMASDNVGSLAGRARKWVQKRKGDVGGFLLLNSSTVALLSSFNSTANLETLTSNLKALFASSSTLTAATPISSSNQLSSVFEPVTRTISEEASVHLTQEFESLQSNVAHFSKPQDLVGPYRTEWVDYNTAYQSGDVQQIETTLQAAYESAGFVYNNSLTSPVCTHDKYTELQSTFGGATITPEKGSLVLVAPFSQSALSSENLLAAPSTYDHGAPKPV